MVYSLLNFDFYNKKYKDVLKIALSHSDCFSFFTSKNVRTKNHPDTYFDFLERLNAHKISSDKVEIPKYTSGQQLHCYEINKTSEQILSEPSGFTAWDSYDYPEDLAFYKNKTPWLRCISHEKMVLINDINSKALNEIKSLGVDFMPIKDMNRI